MNNTSPTEVASPETVMVGVRYTLDINEAFMFQDHNNAMLLAGYLARLHGEKAAVIQHGPAKYPNQHRWTVTTEKGTVKSTKLSGLNIEVRCGESTMIQFHSAK